MSFRHASLYGIISRQIERGHPFFGGKYLESLEIARKAVEAAEEKQASEIVLLDVSKVSSFADYFIICSGESWRQIEAVGEEIAMALKKEGIHAHHTEGTVKSGWVLLDYGSVIVHVFAPEKRQFYGLEELWSSAHPVVMIQ